jgi:hypothetical protein
MQRDEPLKEEVQYAQADRREREEPATDGEPARACADWM